MVTIRHPAKEETLTTRNEQHLAVIAATTLLKSARPKAEVDQDGEVHMPVRDELEDPEYLTDLEDLVREVGGALDDIGIKWPTVLKVYESKMTMPGLAERFALYDNDGLTGNILVGAVYRAKRAARRALRQ